MNLFVVLKHSSAIYFLRCYKVIENNTERPTQMIALSNNLVWEYAK